MLRHFTSERIRKAHRQRTIFMVSMWTVFACSLFFLIVALVASKQISIASVAIEGNKAITDKDIFAVVEPKLDGSYFHLFSRRNIFFFPKNTIEADILKQLVRIKNVSVDRDGLSHIVVTVSERSPDGLWCGTATSSSTVCTFVDDAGLAFALAPVMTGRSFVVYEHDMPSSPVGKQLVLDATFREIGDVMSAVATLGFTTRRVVWSVDALDLVTSYIAHGTDATVRLRVPLAGPYDTALSNLVSIVQSQKGKEVVAGKETPSLDFTNLDYIDLRFEDRVFYKDKGASNVSDTATTSAQ